MTGPNSIITQVRISIPLPKDFEQLDSLSCGLSRLYYSPSTDTKVVLEDNSLLSFSRTTVPVGCC